MRAGVFELLGSQVAVLVFAQHLGQDQQAVKRRAQLVRHVGQELGLVLRYQRELLGFFLQRFSRLLDLAVLFLDLGVLLFEQLGLLLQLQCLLFQRGIGALERILLLGQLLGLVLQLLRPGLATAAATPRCACWP